MDEIILEIMFAEYCGEYREKYSEFMEFFSEFTILECGFLYEMHT